ncbi:FAR1 DNA binding domain, zinc finger, SWIM-type, MULE transposase domain containing protein [Tanacetum coccineum]
MFSSSTGLFSFQFSSREGLNAMLENSPWFIRNSPLILKKWHPDLNLLKKDVGTIPVWVKIHSVIVTMFSEDGLSAIETKLDDVELRDNIVEAMPKITGEGYYTCNIRILYEWKPHRCVCCKVFGHTQKECPKNVGTGKMKNLKKTSQTPKGFPSKMMRNWVQIEELWPVKRPILVDLHSGIEDEVASIDNDMAKLLAKKDGYVVLNADALHIYKDKMKELLNQAEIDVPPVPKVSSKAVMSAMLGVDEPDNVLIGNPNLSKVKGTGCFSRMKLVAEVIVEELAKRRTCSVCGGKEGHNKRTCTNEPASKKPKVQAALKEKAARKQQASQPRRFGLRSSTPK